MSFRRLPCFARAIACFLLVFALTGSARNAAGEISLKASSTHVGDYAAKLALDGNRQTRWASAGFSGKPEWIQIDFGKPTSVRDVVIQWERAHAAEYRIEVSSDGVAWETVAQQKESRGGRERIKGTEKTGRFVRVLCQRPASFGLFSIWEIEFVGGDAAKAVAEVRREAELARQAATEQVRQRLLAVIRQAGCQEIVFAVRQPGKDGHWYANFSHYSDDENRLTYGNGGRLCRLNLATGELKSLLEDAEGGIRDPVVHYDAKKILFSYRKGGDSYYHLYELGLDGGNLRQLTDGPYDDIEPCYLPDGRIVFVSSRCKRWVQCWLTRVAVLHRCNADGSGIRPISANLEHDNTPWPLHDGRLIYQRWEYVDRSQVDYHHLWSTYPDGTGQMIYYGNLHPSTVMIDAKPIPRSQKVVAIFSPGHGRKEHDGVITVVDASKGPDEKGTAVPVSRDATYRDPWAFSEDAFLAVRGSRVILMDAAGVECEVFRLSSADEAAGLECHEARPLMIRERERIIADRAREQNTTGQLVLVDVYKGRNMTGIQRGEIKKLLVMESLPKPINFTGGMDPLTYGGSFTLERVLGTVPVEPDGSAYMELPALRALFFIALDQNDLAVKRMQSFLTVQPGEMTGCVGCHEQRTETFVAPAELAALRREPSPIEPISGCPDVFDFPRDIQPILDKLCVDCHGYQKTPRGGPYAGNVILSGDRGPMFSHAYFTMTVRKLFSDGRNQAQSNYAPRSLGSSASRILQMLDGTHYDAKADSHQKTILRLWIDAGAPYPGTYGALGCGAIGGYIQNNQVNLDTDWPTTLAGADVIQRRCAECHQAAQILPKSMSDERGLSFWRFDMNDPLLRLSRHIVFNLSKPEHSLLLLAPLATESGGYQLCRDGQARTQAIFRDTRDPDYQKLLAMIEAGRANLESIKRFDMPGFQPPQQYVREMKRYGVLAADHPLGAAVDPYDLDRRYWSSLWYRPR